MEGARVGPPGGPARRRRTSPRRRRSDPAVARQELLAAGLALAAERSEGDVLGHLRIADLARSADVTTGAFYHYWDNQQAYRDEVVDLLLAGDRPDADPARLRPQPGEDTDPVLLVDSIARRVHAELVHDPTHRLELALWAHGDGRVAQRLLERARRADEVIAAHVGAWCAATGRAPVRPADAATVATALVTLGDGLRTLHLIDPDATESELTSGLRSWSTSGLLTMLVLLGSTGPSGAADAPAQSVHSEPVPEASTDTGGRVRLLRLGADAALAQPTGNAFEDVRAEDVVRRLGLTIGALYHYWDSQDDYRDDLVDALFEAERYVDPLGIEGADRRLAGARDVAEAVRAATTWYWSVAAEHPDNRIQFTFHALDDPYITPRLAAWNASLRRSWHSVVDNLLERFDRTWRPPLTTDLVVLGLSAALDGLIVRHGLDPTDLGPDADGWTAWGRTAHAMFTAGAAPRGDDRDLVSLAWEPMRR